jgi:pseudouridine-5'-phosphate glycosidase
MPGFYSRTSGVPAPVSVADETELLALARTHLGLGLGSSLLACIPVPAAAALSLDEARAAVERATTEADAAGLHGPAVTPWLLARIAELTHGASLRANTALIENDARVAGRLAAGLVEAPRS